ncbi:S-adenosyl-L-methionine-dependent methyltransferase [Syncephalis fuscata]|nr:S-adenosyl-L-methionine-dependent methyltransferase [Syncephalis fuscata]
MGNLLTNYPSSKQKQFSFATNSNKSSSGSGDHKSDTSNFKMSLGRRYHNEKNVPYLLPNDIEEADRLDTQHYIVHELVKSNHLCNLDNPRRIIDIGAGTGTWAMEMAAEFRDCQVLGIDISPIQPKSIRPPNINFEIMNILEGLRYEANTFDYVHSRFLCAAIPKTYWPTLIRDMARICSSSGAVEICETDGVFHNGGPLGIKIGTWIKKLCALGKVDLGAVWDIPEMMQDAGLRLEEVRYYQLPIGSWYGRLGELAMQNYIDGTSSMRSKFVDNFNETIEDVDAAYDNLHNEANNCRFYWKIAIYVGRKL